MGVVEKYRCMIRSGSCQITQRMGRTHYFSCNMVVIQNFSVLFRMGGKSGTAYMTNSCFSKHLPFLLGGLSFGTSLNFCFFLQQLFHREVTDLKIVWPHPLLNILLERILHSQSPQKSGYSRPVYARLYRH